MSDRQFRPRDARSYQTLFRETTESRSIFLLCSDGQFGQATSRSPEMNKPSRAIRSGRQDKRKTKQKNNRKRLYRPSHLPFPSSRWETKPSGVWNALHGTPASLPPSANRSHAPSTAADRNSLGRCVERATTPREVIPLYSWATHVAEF